MNLIDVLNMPQMKGVTRYSVGVSVLFTAYFTLILDNKSHLFIYFLKVYHLLEFQLHITVIYFNMFFKILLGSPALLKHSSILHTVCYYIVIMILLWFNKIHLQ